MDSRSRASLSSDNPRVRAALREYFSLIDQGGQFDTEAFIERYPNVAAELRSFIELDQEAQQIGRQPDSDVDSRRAGATNASSPSTKSAASTFSVASQLAGTAHGKSDGAHRPVSGSVDDLPIEFGKYRIKHKLGEGAMGAVYLAEDTMLHRMVAIKTPTFDDDQDGSWLRRFYREAQAVSQLKHPNLCAVYDVGEIDGRYYIAMEFVPGKKLQEFIRPDKPMTEKQAITVARKVALAMQVAHTHGVIHRDLKPDNIMINDKGEPVVMDFGLVRRTESVNSSSITKSGMLVGSPAYMSKEQVEGDPSQLTSVADQYSLGVILYQMLTSKLPFDGGLHAVLAAIVTKDPPPPSQYRSDLNPHLEAVCLKMMAKEAKDRYPSMKDAAAALLDVAKGTSSAASQVIPVSKSPHKQSEIEPVTGAEQPEPAGGAIAWIVFVLFGACLLGIVSFVGVTALNRKSKDPTTKVGNEVAKVAPDKAAPPSEPNEKPASQNSDAESEPKPNPTPEPPPNLSKAELVASSKVDTDANAPNSLPQNNPEKQKPPVLPPKKPDVPVRRLSDSLEELPKVKLPKSALFAEEPEGVIKVFEGLPGSTHRFDLWFSYDGEAVLANARSHSLCGWQLKTGRLWKASTAGDLAAPYTPKNSVALFYGGGKLAVLNTATAAQTPRVDALADTGTICWSKDGSMIAVGGFNSGTIQIFDRLGKVTHEYTFGKGINALSFAQKDEAIFFASGGQLKMWRFKEDEVRDIRQHSTPVVSIYSDPSTEYVMSIATPWERPLDVAIWHPDHPGDAISLIVGETVMAFEVTDDWRRVLTAEKDGNVICWDLPAETASYRIKLEIDVKGEATRMIRGLAMSRSGTLAAIRQDWTTNITLLKLPPVSNVSDIDEAQQAKDLEPKPTKSPPKPPTKKLPGSAKAQK